ncbi:MAG: ResB-like [Frankiales bacterium]|nr:ResB-like [Frankiales bacterium]
MTLDQGALTDTATATRMSTQPLAPSPRRGQRLAAVRQLWRQLTSMRTALILLFLLALASVPGGFVPQRTLNPAEVARYKTDHPTLYPVLDKLSLFDVFASPWFAAIYLLLFVSLIGCLAPRIRLHARALRQAPPKLPARLDRLPLSDRWETDLSPQDALAAARSQLRGKRWRSTVRPGGVSAEKGYLRETGNLLFHVSLVVLLIGIAVGNLYGFKGTVLVKEGDGFANTVLAYDDVQPGRRFSADGLVPFNFDLRAFNATYADDGKALTFDAEVDWAPSADAPKRPYDIRVNHPLHVGAAKVYLIGHGYAPHVVVRDRAGNVALDQTVACLPRDGNFVSACVIKVPNAVDATGKADQFAFQGVFTPTTVQDPATGQVTSVFPGPVKPGLTLLAYRGDLGVDQGVSQSVFELDTASLTPVAAPPQGLLEGQTWTLPDGGSISYVATSEWATFQVTQDPGKLVALGAAVGIVLGLLLSLRIRRRRVWVRAALPAGGGAGPPRTVVEVGGLARTDPDAFAAEFGSLAERLRAAVPPAPAQPPEEA